MDDALKLARLRADAEHGDARAQRLLALRYLRGRGTEEDHESAVAWLRRAAEQGLALAVRDLGECYEAGWGVTRDAVRAVQLYRRAAELGDPIARSRLAGEHIGSLMKVPPA